MQKCTGNNILIIITGIIRLLITMICEDSFEQIAHHDGTVFLASALKYTCHRARMTTQRKVPVPVLVPGTRYQNRYVYRCTQIQLPVPGTWYQVPGTAGRLIPCSWHQVPGTWYRYQVPGIEYDGLCVNK